MTDRPGEAALVGASALALGLPPEAPLAAWEEALGLPLPGPEALAGALEAHWAQGRARRSAAAWPSLHPIGPPPSLLPGHRLEEVATQAAPRWLWLLAYALSWHTDDAGGGIAWVATEAQGPPVLLSPAPWPWPPAEVPPGVGPSLLEQGQGALAAWKQLEALPEGPELPPLARLAAEGLARAWAEGQWAGPARAAEARYHASAARVQAAAQGQGAPPGPKAEAMAARLLAERRHRWGELARRHAMRAQLQAIATLVVQRPGWQRTFRLFDLQGQAAVWTGRWDGLLGRWEGLVCAHCGEAEGPFGVASGQVLCAACTRPCLRCARPGAWRLRCLSCQALLCPACAVVVPTHGLHCPVCAPACPRCGVASLASHHACPFGADHGNGAQPKPGPAG